MVGNLSTRSDEITALLAAGGPLSLEVLARLVNVAPVLLRRHLDEHPHLLPTPDGEWVSGLRLADGVAFTHELTAAEVVSGMLSADDDLALWAQFAIGGLPLAGGGEVRATTVLDLPPLARIRGLGRAEVVAGTMALGLLLTWIDEDPEHGPSLLRDYLTATPAVVGYVADEVERRAAEGTRFDDQLAMLQGIAKTGPERAAVTLLAARAAEGSGGSVTAERLAHEASG